MSLHAAGGRQAADLVPHRKKLVEAGLVHREMCGRWAYFTHRPEGLAALRTFLGELP